MFGVIIFLPQYLQVVRGDVGDGERSDDAAVLCGVLLTSIVSGRLISPVRPLQGLRGGRHDRRAPSGWCLLAQLGPHTSLVDARQSGCSSPAPAWACSCRPLVMATQSAVETRDLGIATSSVMFFRTMGGAVCASAFGALLTNRLAVGLHPPPAAGGRPLGRQLGRQAGHQPGGGQGAARDGASRASGSPTAARSATSSSPPSR